MGEEDDNPKLSDRHLPGNKKKYVPGRGIQRYSEALKNLIPIRRKRSDEGTMPLDNAGLFALISSSWISKFMYKAHRTGFTMEELPSLSPYESCDYNVGRLDLLWKKELAKQGPEKASFSMVAWRFCRTRVLISFLLFTCNMLCGFLNLGLFMRKLLECVQSGGGSYEEGIKWALLLAASESGRILFLTWANILNYRTGLRLRSACLTLLYRHIIDANNLETQNIGAVINIFSNDAQRIFDVIVNGVHIIEAPLATLFVLFYVLWLFSPIGLLGMVVFLFSYPIQYAISQLVGRYQSQTMKISDMRVRLMNEILDCIKLIKMYAWEKRFSEDLLGLRKMERRVLLKKSYVESLNSSLTPTIPGFSAMITYFAHLAAGNNLTAAQVFPFSSFLNSRYRISLFTFRMALDNIISAGISFNRMRGVLLSENKECSLFKPILKSQAIAITNGTFAYNTFVDNNGESSRVDITLRKDKRTSDGDKSEKEKLKKPKVNAENVDVLFDISFEANKGKLIGICGHVGSGKSSLLLAALGQLRVSNGQVTRDGSCAYVSQQAWITNATLRENILFGEKYDSSRYNKAIYACCLSQDIAMMPGGDETEIGERGVNLSGGQKQRVALARALYADRDIYLLDDPLSAVDSRVGSHIFHNLILGALKGKTILLVTHQIQYLNRCDDIYVMSDGKIIEHGTHDELMKSFVEYASMVAAISTVSETKNDISLEPGIMILPKSIDDIPLQKDNQNCAVSPCAQKNGKTVQKLPTPSAPLIVAENLQRGTIKADTYHSYITAAGGYCIAIFVISNFVIVNGTINFSSWWLSWWLKAGGGNTTIVKNNATILSDNLNDNPDLWYYQSIYAVTIGFIVLTGAMRSFIFRHTTIGASTKIHNKLFEKIINSPMRFFDTTPSGRIQHLFSRDMDEVDNKLPASLAYLIQTAITMMFTLLGICLVFPWFTLPLCLLGVIFYYISRIFRAAIRDLKRMDNKSRAPVVSFVTATIQGLSTIHAFEKENDFVAKFINLLDENSKYLFMFSVGTTWLTLRMDALSVMSVSITGFLVIIFQDQVPPALAGLALSFSFQIAGFLPFSLQKWSETEARFTSVERISHCIRTLEPEGKMGQSIVKPPSIWPEAAAIKFINVNMAYGVGTADVLQNVTFTVNASEKIGIVGRTGSGKSSLTVALFRLVELTGGKIEIDDIDISEISLSQLRSKLSIIPQDPVLFSGTVRSNLDPFKLYTDAEIWEALEKTELKGRVQSIPGQLDAPVGFGGDNMSLGERQLLCLSRALLRNSKILVLDEATAAVDPETEMIVQNTVQREFSNCTILTIAHRLHTVLSLNRVLVMDDGKILEFDTPANLLADPSSELSKLMSAAEQAENQ